MITDCPRCHSTKVRLIPEIFGGSPKMYCDGCGHLWAREQDAVYTNEPARESSTRHPAKEKR